MSTDLELLEYQILRLPAADRARLIDRLIASLDPDLDVEAAWDVVASQREESLDARQAQPVPLDLVVARLEARFTG